MKYLKSWLKDFIEINISDQKLIDRLTMTGTEIELIKAISGNNIIDSDLVIEAEITPNRGDCLSHLGLAREIAAFSGQKIKKEEHQSKNIESDLRVEIENQEDCPRYYAKEINNIKIGPSPDWLVERLEKLGTKSINNVVDVTNYVMLDLGHPLHVFDADDILNKKIIVRNAREGEKITLLDEKEVLLNQKDLLIADGEKGLALAGVMGGVNTGVTDSTTNIILEAAEFEPTTIRKTSKRLGISSDASYRFERGIDSNAITDALNKAAKMILEYAGGQEGRYTFAGAKYESKVLTIPYDKINNLLDLELSEEEINKILLDLGFEIRENETLIPSWRHDIAVWQDLAEEVERTYGISELTRLELPHVSKPPKSIYYQKEHLKDIIAGLGFVEVKNYPFLSEKDIKLENISTDNLIEVANPVQQENKYLRNSLLPPLLKNIAKNGLFDPILLFEIGNVFENDNEKTNLGIVAAGKNSKELIDKMVSELSEKIGVISPQIKEISGEGLQKLKIRKPVVYSIEFSIDKISLGNDIELNVIENNYKYNPVSKYPSVARDLAFIVDENVDAKAIMDSIMDISEMINWVELFDEFLSDKFGTDKKNLAYHIYLQDMNKTLTDAEADEIVKKIVNKIENEFGAKLRIS